MASGITINRTSRGIERVGRNISNLYDFYQAGFNKVVLEESATDTILCLEIEFLVPVLLEGVYGDTIALGVNDNLTGFTKMSAIARGKTNA